MTWPPTLYDDQELYRAAKVRPDAPDLPTAQVRAPCCGRETAADAVRDLRGVPDTKVRPGGRGGERDIAFACDACYRRTIATDRNPWSESQLVRALGAPRTVQLEKRAREELQRVRRESGVESPYKPREVLERTKRTLDTPGAIEGTETPVELP